MNLNSACDAVSKTIYNFSPYEIWDIVLSIISVIVSSVLTALIIRQTKKLNDKQQELDKMLNESQKELQQRQLKLDLYNYRRGIYINLAKIYDFTEFAKVMIVDDKSIKYEIAKNLANTTIKISKKFVEINSSEISSVLVEANCLFNTDISEKILCTNYNYKMLWIDLNELITLDKKMHSDKKYNMLLEEFVDDAKFRINEILATKDIIMDSIKTELDVSNLEK